MWRQPAKLNSSTWLKAIHSQMLILFDEWCKTLDQRTLFSMTTFYKIRVPRHGLLTQHHAGAILTHSGIRHYSCSRCPSARASAGTRLLWQQCHTNITSNFTAIKRTVFEIRLGRHPVWVFCYWWVYISQRQRSGILPYSITVMSRRLRSSATRLFVQQLVHVYTKENIMLI